MTNQLKRYGLIGLALLAAATATVVTMAGRTNSSQQLGGLGASVSQADRCAGLNRDGTYFVKQSATLPDGREYCRVFTYDRPGGKIIRQSLQNPCPECPAPKTSRP